MTTVVPPVVGEALGHDSSVKQPPLHGPSKEVLDLALLAIDRMPGLSPTDRMYEEEQVVALLDDIEADEQRRQELDEWLQRAAGTGEMRYQVLARLMGVAAPVEQAEEISGREITQRLETQGYVRQAPKFADQLEDESREEVRFQFDDQTFSDAPGDRGRHIFQTNESRGIRQLSGFLADFISKSARHLGKAGFAVNRDAAKSIRNNLTYIGGKELDEGSSGIAQYWHDYLLQDETNTLCIVTASSLGKERKERDRGGSDDFIRDKILESMAKAGAPASLADRIITNPRQLNGDPKKVKVVFVDDWVVSGAQMRKKIFDAQSLIDGRYHDTLEVNTLTAPPHFISDGLTVGSASIPVRAYYRAHKASAEASEGVKCHITGTHSTVNFGFSVQIERMKKLSNQILGQGQRPVRMPAVASVYRPYWN